MKINRSLTAILIIVGFFIWIGSAGPVQGAPSDPVAAETAKVPTTDAGYLESINFEKLKGKERVILVLSRQSGAAASDLGGKTVTVRVENLFIPQELRRAMGEGVLDNLIRVVPTQKTDSGKPQAMFGIELKKRVPFSVRQEGHHVIIDFNVASLPAGPAAAAISDKQALPETPAAKGAAPVQTPPVQVKDTPPQARAGRLISMDFQEESLISVLQFLAKEGNVKIIPDHDVDGRITVSKKNIPWEEALDTIIAMKCLAKKRVGDTIHVSNKKISIAYQDAPIKGVLSTLAELCELNIAATDDVKGNVTVELNKVAWEKALDTVLSIRELTRMQSGNIITVVTKDKFRKNEEDRRKDEEARKKEDQALKESEGKKKQIVIEAKILEATDEFVRRMGVQWGAGFTDNLRVNKGLYPYGMLAGANPVGGTPFGALQGLAQGVALTPGNLAANFPMSAGIPSFALGMTISSAYAILDAEIAAAEKTSEVRIISSPKITTMDGAKAVIKQGEDVPIVMPATAQSPASVSFKEAVLKLEVKPTITPAGKISMEVKANNDAPDYARAAQLQGNPPISKSEVESKVVVTDGETMVVGGILKATTAKANMGLPWVSKVPILGWLFKYDELLKNRKQLLIFITPRIVTDDAPAGEAKTKQKS